MRSIVVLSRARYGTISESLTTEIAWRPVRVRGIRVAGIDARRSIERRSAAPAPRHRGSSGGPNVMTVTNGRSFEIVL
ncbi:hypothetical protein AKJ13_13055 [Methylobacterium sp. ARG-1]|nr:hypothetical protein AKJ13_13055 [Methylobacterium sp. ARG-1]